MKKIKFENAEIITPAKVTIDNKDYEVTPAQLSIIEKCLSAETLNELQDNIEESAIIVSPTEPTTNEKVWIQKGKNLFNPKTMVELTNAYRRFSDGLITGLDGFNGIKVPVKPNTQYAFSTDSGDFSNVTFYDKNFNLISGFFRLDENQVITTPEKCYYFCMAIHNEYTWIQVEQGSTATEYEAYVDRKINVGGEKFLDVEKVNNNLNYSTEEQVIGTWTKADGTKVPLYRKVIYGTTPSTSADAVVFSVHDIENIIDIKGIINDWLPIGSLASDTYLSVIYRNPNTEEFMMSVGTQIYNKPFAATLKYTKKQTNN